MSKPANKSDPVDFWPDCNGSGQPQISAWSDKDRLVIEVAIATGLIPQPVSERDYFSSYAVGLLSEAAVFDPPITGRGYYFRVKDREAVATWLQASGMPYITRLLKVRPPKPINSTASSEQVA